MSRNGCPIIIKVGSRESNLALIQTNYVIKLLERCYGSNYDFQVKTMKTIGDKILEKPLPEIGDKGLFTAELETALLNNQVDFIVHSLKDLPTTLPDGCAIGAILEREDPSDAVVLREGLVGFSITDFLKGSFHSSNSPSIGTSSLKRQSQLKLNNPQVKLIDIRGNINTRLDKLDGKKGEVHYDALVLATSGLKRGGFEHRITFKLDDHWYYAIGQGALAVECRAGDVNILSLLKPILDKVTIAQVLAERSLLYHLEGGCSVPIGVRSTFSSGELKLEAAVFSLDGSVAITDMGHVTLDLNSCNNHVSMNGAGERARTKYKPTKPLVGMSASFDELSPGFMLPCYELGKQLAQALDEKGSRRILQEIKEKREKKLGQNKGE